MKSIQEVYTKFIQNLSLLSKDNRIKVGAMIETKSGIIIPGYNGTPKGWDNECQDENNVTKLDVIHAELNCILKAASEGISVVGGTLYTTLSPCESCSAMIYQAGIKEVYYLDDYRIMKGVDNLRKYGIVVSKLTKGK